MIQEVGNLNMIELGWASANSPQSSLDPGEAEAMRCLEEGTQKLEEVCIILIYYLSDQVGLDVKGCASGWCGGS
jgi:hypothetical protein